MKGLYSSIGCNIALLEYRGYGRSEGSPSEEGIYMDAQAALDFLTAREDLAIDKIILFFVIVPYILIVVNFMFC